MVLNCVAKGSAAFVLMSLYCFDVTTTASKFSLMPNTVFLRLRLTAVSSANTLKISTVTYGSVKITIPFWETLPRSTALKWIQPPGCLRREY